jgi:hypothetical protein
MKKAQGDGKFRFAERRQYIVGSPVFTFINFFCAGSGSAAQVQPTDWD